MPIGSLGEEGEAKSNSSTAKNTTIDTSKPPDMVDGDAVIPDIAKAHKAMQSAEPDREVSMETVTTMLPAPPAPSAAVEHAVNTSQLASPDPQCLKVGIKSFVAYRRGAAVMDENGAKTAYEDDLITTAAMRALLQPQSRELLIQAINVRYAVFASEINEAGRRMVDQFTKE